MDASDSWDDESHAALQRVGHLDMHAATLSVYRKLQTWERKLLTRRNCREHSFGIADHAVGEPSAKIYMYAFWIETFFVRVSQCGWRDVEQLFGARHCRERMVVAVDKGAYGASGAIGHFMVFYIETSGLGTESVGHRLAFKSRRCHHLSDEGE